MTVLAASITGPALFVSYIIAGFVAMLTALVFAEMAGRMPYCGSSYTFIYSIYGEFPAMIASWN